jgi:hypothetical protein
VSKIIKFPKKKRSNLPVAKEPISSKLDDLAHHLQLHAEERLDIIRELAYLRMRLDGQMVILRKLCEVTGLFENKKLK